MDIIISLLTEIPLIFFGFLFLIFFLLLYLIQYFYISYNLKGICKIIFNDEGYFKLPLEPFNSFFISVLPIIFWRETLNIKKGVNFKKLYGKDFYYSINKGQLEKMLKQYPKLFYVQYLIYFSCFAFIFLLTIAFILDKFLY